MTAARRVSPLLAALLVALAASVSADTPQLVGSAFTYQGRLVVNGIPANGSYDLRFTPRATNGQAFGPVAEKLGVPVANGLFTVSIDFGPQYFTPYAMELEIAVRAAGGGAYTTLSPNQRVNPAPFAIYSTKGTATDVAIPFSAGGAAAAQAAFAIVNSGASTPDHPAVAINGFVPCCDHGIAVLGSAPTGTGVFGSLSTAFPQNVPVAAVVGDGEGVGPGVYGRTTSQPAVWGAAVSGSGVVGASQSGVGVEVGSVMGNGIDGGSITGYGAHLTSNSSAAVYAENTSTTNKAYLATTYAAADFKGDVAVYGTLSKQSGSFKIDHPLDPEHKWLLHSFVESPDMKNIYDGVVTLDERGEALVEMPEWFEALNMDFRYQLTCLGGWAPVFVSEKIASNRFRIAGGTAGLEVSWQVTGTRHDTWANTHRIRVEEEKTGVPRR